LIATFVFHPGVSALPIHDLGYRPWEGKLESDMTRWWVIAAAGIKIAFRSSWVKRVVLFAWLPAITFGVFMLVYERNLVEFSRSQPETVRGFFQNTNFERFVAGSDTPMVIFGDRNYLYESLKLSIGRDTESKGRHMFWSWMLITFLRYPQGGMLLILVGLIAPPLISKDMRTRAFLMYFSRPIGRFEYIFGKVMIVAFFISAICFVPAMTLYVVGVSLSPDLSVIWDTWDLPFRIAGATLVAAVPTASMALMLSSLTTESRFAGFAWFSIWTLGAVAWSVIYTVRFASFQMQGNTGANAMLAAGDTNLFLLSPYETIGRCQRWVFGIDANLSESIPSMLALSLITIISFVILYRRVSAPIRV
jgi:ABC-2 type transport system permease protein